MAFIPTPNVARFDVAYDWNGQHVENSVWFQHGTSPFDVPTLTECANLLATQFSLGLMPHLSQQLVMRGVIAYAQDSETAPAIEVSVGSVPGGVTDFSVPNNVAWCVKFVTANRGRSGRGRNYVPGIPMTNVETNLLDEIVANDIVTVYNNLLAGGPMDPYIWVVVSHFTAGAPRAAGLAQQVELATYSDLVVDSQRRRLPGRGT